MLEQSSVAAYKLKKLVKTLASKKGRGTELISLYIPPDRAISSVIDYLKQERSTAENIKSEITRKHVTDALTKVIQYLKLLKELPKSGLAIFCGAIPDKAPGTEELEIYSVVPLERIDSFIYRCDDHFFLEPLKRSLARRDVYGIMVIDAKETTYALLKGKDVEILKTITSGIPGKHRAGGQSARRFQRLRQFELNEYFKRVGAHANSLFGGIKNLKGILIGGPGFTKHKFIEGDYMNYILKGKILATVDTSYVEEQGVKEVISKASQILQNTQYVSERNLMQEFLYNISHSTGRAVYGEDEVRQALEKGLVRTLILSEKFDVVRLTYACTSCNFKKEEKLKDEEVVEFQEKLQETPCPLCSAKSLKVVEVRDVIEEFIKLAEDLGVNVQIVSTATEEGQSLLTSFGGVAALL